MTQQIHKQISTQSIKVLQVGSLQNKTCNALNGVTNEMKHDSCLISTDEIIQKIHNFDNYK